MPTKKETNTSSAKKTTVKKAPTEAKAPAAVASRPVRAAKKEASQAPVAAQPSQTEVVATAAKPVKPRKTSAEKAAPSPTRIMAYVDVGHGNNLYLRGEGGGLSWDKGVPMECIGGDCWSWSVDSALHDITFKVLINDQRWSAGDNLTVAFGQTATFIPAF